MRRPLTPHLPGVIVFRHQYGSANVSRVEYDRFDKWALPETARGPRPPSSIGSSPTRELFKKMMDDAEFNSATKELLLTMLYSGEEDPKSSQPPLEPPT